METKADAMARLHDMKEQQPFRAFDLVTSDGIVLPVAGRYLFAFNGHYVLVADASGRTTRVRLEKVARIDHRN